MKKFRIVVAAYGRSIIAISDGTEEGTTIKANESDINIIKTSIRLKREVDITHSRYRNYVIAGYESPLALTAALCSIDEMRSLVWSAPDEVMDYIRNNNDGCGSFLIEDYQEGN